MKIYVVTTGENEITVSLNGEAAVTKTVKPTLTALGNGRIQFICDDINEIVETYRNIFINAVPLKGSWIAEEDYLSVALFEAIMNKTFTSSSSPGGSSCLLSSTFGSAAITATDTDRFIGFGIATTSTNESFRQTIIPVAGIISALYIRATNSALNGSEIRFQLRINGASVGDPINFSLSDSSVTTNTVALSAPVVAGDLVSILVFNNTSNIVSLYSIAIKIT